jgi:hypothetical protein
MPSGRPAASCQAFATWRITATSALMSDTAATTDRRLSHAATTAGVTTAVRCGSQPQRSRELRSPDTVAAGYCDRQPQRRAGIVIAEHRSPSIAVARMWRRAAIPWSGITVIRHCDSQGICDGQGGDCQALSIRHRASGTEHRVPGIECRGRDGRVIRRSPVLLGEFGLDVPRVCPGAAGAQPPHGPAIAFGYPGQRIRGQYPLVALATTAHARHGEFFSHAQTLRHPPTTHRSDRPNLIMGVAPRRPCLPSA